VDTITFVLRLRLSKGVGRKAFISKYLEDALGQFILYERLLIRYAPERTLYLAVSDSVYKTVFEEEAGQILLEDKLIRLLTFNPEQEVITQWIPS